VPCPRLARSTSTAWARHAPADDAALAVPTGALKAEGVRWNLTDLYAGPLDPGLADDTATAHARAERFASAYRGRIASGEVGAAELHGALVEYESIQELGQRPAFYASLFAAADSQDPVALDLEQRTTEQVAELRTVLVFFELELTGLADDAFAALAADARLTEYRHFLHTLRRFKPHLLAEGEERLLARKDLSGRAAFVQLYDELASSLRFRVEIDGERRELADGEVMALLHHRDRDLRARALDELLSVYAAERLPLAAIMNALLLDHRVECEMRGYPDLAAPTHLANEIEPALVAAMMDAVERHYPVIQEYLRLKARLLALPRLATADVYAPLDDRPEAIPYGAARATILEGFGRFSGVFADLAASFFDDRWIDAEVRPGKRHGAFCASLGPRHHPYVLASFAGTARDVATLAHELGHGIHYVVARRQTLLNYDPPLVLAETASVFAEMLMTDHLLALAPDRASRRRILVETLDEMYGTVFRQHALTRFELAAHEARRQHRLGADDLCALWSAAQERLFGDAVDMSPSYRFGWSYIPHFVHSRFYCYAYAFGELLTLALFQRYRAEGPAFLPHYVELLASGGSRDPAELLTTLGFDITDPAFWDAGCGAIAAMVAELRQSLD
jgi:oligoendopeptidase F